MSKQMTVGELVRYLSDKNQDAPVYLMTEVEVPRYHSRRRRWVQVNAPVMDVAKAGDHVVIIGHEKEQK